MFGCRYKDKEVANHGVNDSIASTTAIPPRREGKGRKPGRRGGGLSSPATYCFPNAVFPWCFLMKSVKPSIERILPCPRSLALRH